MTRKTKNNTRLIYYTKYNKHLINSPGESSDLPSLTSQGEAVSMAEMIRKFTRGEIPPLAKEAFHGHDINIENYSGSRPPEDLTEVEQEAREVKASRQRKEAAERLQKAERSEAMKEAKRGVAEPAKQTTSEGDEPAQSA